MNFSIHMLDNPLWWSLSTCHRDIAEICGTTFAMAEDFGPFVACSGASEGELQDLTTLLAKRTTPALLMSRDLPRGWNLKPSAFGVQLVSESLSRPKYDARIEPLTIADAGEIYALARRTRPGPFEHRTHELGEFIGIKRDGSLIAMAGQRAKLPGYTEISAVCVDRAHRGRGYGSALVRQMATRILDKGNQPFLHTYADNKVAIALYEKLGFRIRTGVKLLRLDKEALSLVTGTNFATESAR